MSGKGDKANAEHGARSQASIVEESKLRTAIKKICMAQEVTARQIAELEEREAFFTKKVVVEGEERLRFRLNETMTQLATARDLVKSCERQKLATEEAIEKLFPSPAAQRDRLEQQAGFKRLAEARLEKDRKADALLKELRRVLQERAEPTARMAKIAGVLSLELPKEGMDTARFESLLNTLPDDLAGASEKWHAQFVEGRAANAKPYIVREEHLLVSETLADHGLYHFGEQIFLSDEDAAFWLAEDRPAASPATPWRSAVPGVMTVEAYQAACAKAREKGVTAQEICFWAEVDRDAEDKKFYRLNGRRRSTRKAVLEVDKPLFDSSIQIKARIVMPVSADRPYKPGEVITLVGKAEAWSLVDAGAIGPPY